MYSIVPCDAIICRAYDIRGRVPAHLNPDVVYTIGRAYATLAQQRGISHVTIGRDGRLSGPQLSAALAAGLMEGGLDVTDIGQVPTPMLSFSCFHLKTGSGIMVTGSHNPKNENGLKMMLAGDTLCGEDILLLKTIAESGTLSTGQGRLMHASLADDYCQAILDRVTMHRPLKVVLDHGNGIAGVIAPRVFRELGCEVVSLFEEIDGDFPHHHPDPSKPQNLADLIQAVQTHQGDIGLAFDGDGDRLGVVTAAGEIIWPDRQMILFAQDVLSRQPNSQIIFDVKCTQQLPKAIIRFGGKPLMCRTGHSFVKRALKETGAPLAGEMSGHLFFNDNWFGFDDAIFAGARLIALLSAVNDIPALFHALPNSINTPEINIAMADDQKFSFIEQFAKNAVFDGGKIDLTDGIRVDFEDGFGLIRASNTTPNLVLRFEGTSHASLERIQTMFMKQMAI